MRYKMINQPTLPLELCHLQAITLHTFQFKVSWRGGQELRTLEENSNKLNPHAVSLSSAEPHPLSFSLSPVSLQHQRELKQRLRRRLRKRRLRCFKLYRAYSISFTQSNVGEFFWSWIPKDSIKVQEKEKKLVVLCSRLRQNVKLGTFTS